MAVNRTQTQFRRRDDALGSITPKVILNEDVRAPKGPPGGWKAAPWLPVQFERQTDIGGKDAFVISSGKVVALDAQSNVVPAGQRILLAAGASALVYTSLDVDYGVEDLVTGLPVAAPVTYSTQQVAAGLIERGLVRSADVLAAGGTLPVASNAHGVFVVEIFISAPVGFAGYDYYVYSGTPEGGDMRFTNYSKQPRVAFYTESEVHVPHLVGNTGTDAFAVATLNGAGTAVYAAGERVMPTEFWNAANVSQITRYQDMGLTSASPVVALGLDPLGTGVQVSIARNTDRTPFTVDTAGVLLRERSAPNLISREGDWFLDADLGVLFVHSDTWATGVAATATWTFSMSFYGSGGATAHKMAHFLGHAKPGARVTFDSHSNFVPAVEGTTAERNILGRVLWVEVQPGGLLSSVKTGFPGSTSATGKLAGSATKGFTDKITLSPERVADQLVALNIKVN